MHGTAKGPESLAPAARGPRIQRRGRSRARNACCACFLPAAPPARRWGSQTNPKGDGWAVNVTGNAGPLTPDNADLCSSNYSALGVRTLANGAKWNVALGDRHYMTQGNWVNWRGGFCALSGTRFNTQWQDAYDLRDLSTHVLECPPVSGLSLFRLQTQPNATADPARPDETLYKATFWYNCPPIPPARLDDAAGPAVLTTDSVPDTDGSLYAFVADPKMIVQCPTRSVLTSWQFVRPSGAELAIQYTCMPLKGDVSCEQRLTGNALDGGGRLAALAYQQMQCEPLWGSLGVVGQALDLERLGVGGGLGWAGEGLR